MACATILVSVVAGCGGGNGKTGAEQNGRPPDVWARDFCTAIQTWADGVRGRTEKMTDDLAQEVGAPGDVLTLSEAKQFRNLLIEGMDDVIVLTDEAGEALKAAGTPAIENGEELSSIFSEFITDFRTVAVDAGEKARAINVRDPEEFNQGAQEFGAAASQFKSAFSEEDADKRFPEAPAELREAFADEPACAGIA
jgi:hypothetical protein